MSDEESRSAREVVEQLADAEGETVVLCFADRIRIPTEPYDGSSYRVETVDETTIRATVGMAEIEDGGISLFCIAHIGDEREQERLGLPTDGVPRDHNGVIGFEISTAREAGESWDHPSALVRVERTERCHKRHAESGGSIQYDPPIHELGEIWNVIGADPNGEGVRK